MSELTGLFAQIEAGDTVAIGQLLPLVYKELHRLASAQVAQEQSGQTLQATALVHEAYLRLVGSDSSQTFTNRRYFFGAAAEAMRRILIEQARRKKTIKRGANWRRCELQDLPQTKPVPDLETLSTALQTLEQQDPQAAELVKLRFFAGFSNSAAAEILGVSERTAERIWAYAKSFLYKEIKQ
ncbi:MAG: ECF-type sigma factor [Pirellulales bacterium]|nr:ECF-type sigma factor [Pirellulales bacterium]